MPDLVIDGRRTDLGGGFAVNRILPFRTRRMVGPFIFLDHAGPLDLPPPARRKADVRPHPHIGLSTVSYLFSGRMTHRDSLGVTQEIAPGAVNWMTAGRGIAHSERFDGAADGDPPMEAVQSWVALPEAAEESAPAFDTYPADTLPVAEEAGTWLRVIAGAAFGLSSPVRTHSPLFYAHARLRTGAATGLPEGHEERAAFIAHGTAEVDGQPFTAGQLLVFAAHEAPTIRATTDATVMLLGGAPLGERFIWWNFVSSRRDRIEQAKADWTEGRIALPPHDRDEWVPLPPDHRKKPPAAEPLS
ncbi:pirin family protein [Marinibaculum pumilum]|uniref:Pirin family protein n=1 Tax=Marinibaculum pumilum TaxID=1766165 RepID=A0ABV7L7U1_9PROT